MQTLGMLHSSRRTGPVVDALNVRGNPHGIRKGWFMWPVNFDPVWLESCDGFEQKEESAE